MTPRAIGAARQPYILSMVPPFNVIAPEMYPRRDRAAEECDRAERRHAGAARYWYDCGDHARADAEERAAERARAIAHSIRDGNRGA